jgi:acyl-CoA synthetase (NDP forming)/GNAT superfamily N-acetyltransferase
MLRFFAPVSPQTAYRAARFAEVDYEATFGIVAELGDELIAVATWQRADDPTAAEVAFAVADEHQARGIGSLLLEHLAATGRAAGLTRFEASTLAENRRMLRVFHEAGWDVTREHVEGVVELSFPIDDDARAREVLYRREHFAEARSVERLLHPGSIAVIGASRDPGSPGHQVVRNLLDGGFTGSLYPVNPAADEIAGLPCHAHVTDVDGPVDVAILSVPAAALDSVVDDCAAKRVHGLVVLTATDGDAAAHDAFARRVVVRARGLGMRVLGPECLGLVNTDPEVSMQATVVPVRPRPGRIGWGSQSGAIGLDLLVRATDGGLGVSTFVSLGDKADVSGNDLLQYWDSDPATDVVLLYLESFGNPRKFTRVARRVSARKPIVAVKSARTTAGRRGAGARSVVREDPDAAVDALFAQTGIIRVDTLEDLLVTAAVLERGLLPRGDRVAVIGNAVGPGVVAADACTAAGLTVTTRVAGDNPVHLSSTVTADAYATSLRTLLDDDGVDAVVAVVVPVPGHDADAAALRRVIGTAARESAKPVVVSVLGQRALVGHAGPAPSFAFPEQAAVGLGRAAAYARWRARDHGVAPDFADVDLTAAHATVDKYLAAHPEGGRLEPAAVRTLLAAAAIGLRPVGESRTTPSVRASVLVEHDVAFGPRVTFAVAGAHPELPDELSVAIAPLTDVDAQDLVRAGRAAPLLFAPDGQPRFAIDALEDVILRVACLADDIPEIARLQLGPVLVGVDDTAVLDAVIDVAPVPAPGRSELRRMRDR